MRVLVAVLIWVGALSILAGQLLAIAWIFNAQAALASIVAGTSLTLVIQLKTNGTGFGILSPVALGVILAAGARVAFTFLADPARQQS